LPKLNTGYSSAGSGHGTRAAGSTASFSSPRVRAYTIHPKIKALLAKTTAHLSHTSMRSTSGELVTPTGAAILKVIVSHFGHPPVFVSESVGVGAGTRTFSGPPNVLRAFVGIAEVRLYLLHVYVHVYVHVRVCSIFVFLLQFLSVVSQADALFSRIITTLDRRERRGIVCGTHGCGVRIC
jgi:hypothetical protein